MLTDAGFTYNGSKLIDPKGNPRQARHPRHLGLVGLGRLEPDHHARTCVTSASTRTSRSSPTGAPGSRTRSRRRTRRCSGRSARRARRTASSTRTSSQNAFIPSGQDGDADRQLGALRTTPKATTLLNQWKGTLDPKKQQPLATKLEKILLERPADHPAVDRPALVDVQHEVLPLLRHDEELLRRPDLHDVPRQHPLVHPHLPGRQGRGVTDG